MSKSSEWALQVQEQDQHDQVFAEREQHYFGLLLSKDRLGNVKQKHELREENQPGETAHKKQV